MRVPKVVTPRPELATITVLFADGPEELTKNLEPGIVNKHALEYTKRMVNVRAFPGAGIIGAAAGIEGTDHCWVWLYERPDDHDVEDVDIVERRLRARMAAAEEARALNATIRKLTK